MYNQPYYQPMNNFQNPYIDRQNQYQGFMQTQPIVSNQAQPFYGKVVDSFDNIPISDVPMDGTPATFIKRDGSEIQLRSWTSQGTIATTSYKPYIEPKEEVATNSSSESLNALYEDFKSFKEEIFGRFDRLDKSVSTKSNSGRGNKREVESDE